MGKHAAAALIRFPGNHSAGEKARAHTAVRPYRSLTFSLFRRGGPCVRPIIPAASRPVHRRSAIMHRSISCAPGASAWRQKRRGAARSGQPLIFWKGGGVRWPVSRILSARSDGRRVASGETIIYLGLPSPAASSGLPAPPRRSEKRRLSAGHLIRREGGAALLGLAPPGVCQPPLLPATLVGSYPTLSPFACVPHGRDHRPVCSLWHFPSPPGYPNGALLLGGGAPCGVRTFLAAAPHTRRATRWSGQRTTFVNA